MTRDFDQAMRDFAETVASTSDAFQRLADQLHHEKLVHGVPLAVRERARVLWDEYPDLGLLDVLALAEKEINDAG